MMQAEDLGRMELKDLAQKDLEAGQMMQAEKERNNTMVQKQGNIVNIMNVTS